MALGIGILSGTHLIECRCLSCMGYLHGTVEPFLEYVSKTDCKTGVLHWEEYDVHAVFNSRWRGHSKIQCLEAAVKPLHARIKSIVLHQKQLTTGTIFQGSMDSV